MGDRARRCEALAANRQSPIVNRKSGVALVITLIMLSVTLVMAIAFLAISRRERNSVGTNTDTTVARLAADSALAAAQAQIVANILTTNAAIYDFHLMVSTNYQNSAGYFIGSQNPTNVNFDFRNVDGAPLNAADFQQNVANLLFLPRVPVAIYNPATGSNEFRFYLDLNRNGRFETNGFTADFDAFNQPTNFAFKVGDPEWVGLLEHPDAPHGPNNHFVARYAFLAQPIGNSLDLNAIHNQAVTKTVNPSVFGGVNDGYFRNQGVGSWELNLAAFLADLNTNIWSADNLFGAGYYQYNEANGYNFNRGVAFDDARALLSYRYGFNYANLASANFVMGGFANTILQQDNIDIYSDGPLQITTTNINEALQKDSPALPWVGANNPANFYSLPSELFDPTKVTANFTNRLQAAGTGNASYDRYTFYRLLDQLGTDSTSDDSRMNLNYDNLVATNAFTGTVGATNLIDWTPLGFFTNAADRLIRLSSARWLAQNFNFYTNTFGASTTKAFSLTNIPVYVNGHFVYTPTVNRLLQLAANIYDASTTNFYPSVFRPVFRVVLNGSYRDVYITDFTFETDVDPNTVGLSGNTLQPYTLPDEVNLLALSPSLNFVNIYGVPWIIGAKKNLPNFNRFYMLNNVQVTRKLQVRRPSAAIPGATETNQMFVMSITNQFGVSFWNSYNTNLVSQQAGGFSVVVRDKVSLTLSNGAAPGANWPIATPQVFTFFRNVNLWPGSFWGATAQDFQANAPDANSFIYTNWNNAYLPESIFRASFNSFEPVTNTPLWEILNPTVPPFPQFGLYATNHIQALIVDGTRIVDYVQLDGPISNRDLSDELRDKPATDAVAMNNGTAMWDTNAYGNVLVVGAPTKGVVNQISKSQDSNFAKNSSPYHWNKPANLPTVLPSTPEAESQYFFGFFHANYVFGGKIYTNTDLVMQDPFTPTRAVYDYTFWQANDPLVHYLATDLGGPSTGQSGRSDDLRTAALPSLGEMMNALEAPNAKIQSRYQPWGRNDQLGAQSANYDTSPYSTAFRDSLVWGSDYWDFPTYKYPTVGWLGRVHRGTPWQTVYLKSSDLLTETNVMGNIGLNTWQIWTGGNGNTYDLAHSAPIEDQLLFDIFTTSPNDNASRGALSINQTNLASWSALLSGVVALTNITDTVEFPTVTSTPLQTNTIIPPASVDAVNSAVGQIQADILKTRADKTLFPLGTFTHVGDILRVPAFTEQSPLLNYAGENYQQYDISDELYEWLPQQTLGLLRLGTPRFVLYCYGQALRPAKDGQVLSGTAFGLVTNYQVTAESAVRAVIRVDNTSGTTPHVIVESSSPLPPD